ncbi:uncharacterized protein LOC106881015 [Octopus bimaculoides]|uniref:uncharacterized protein LOC106881015 n=1 Tax=Octopus bimaculoides TaxID=37653 RepID=UPI00071C447E|nr:uncharacterized protein LOC106881015 [Octopus bimaculoides]|eukprot:XP_014786687.1 PREDICTED: uncharacterized protein LOC106881015 [Octopus bimaculoides]
MYFGMRYSYIINSIKIKDKEAIPIADISAKSVALAFVSNWISRFGVSSRLTTDRGCQFEASLFCELSRILGVHHIRTTSYHPASNGLVECFHRQLKATLHASSDLQSWTEFLPIVLLGCRSAVKADLGFSSAELLYGTTLALLGTMLVPDTSQLHELASYAARLRTYFSNLPSMVSQEQSSPSHVPLDMNSWSHVFVRDNSVKGSLVSSYKGPFCVLSHTPKGFTIEMNGRLETVSVPT